jgi:GNAT superfamily N-acetyltransferase
MEPLTLRPAAESDMPFLLELRRQTMNVHLAASGVTASDADHMDRVRSAFDCANVVLREGEPVGLLKVVREGRQWKLVQVQLKPSVQGKGMGALLLRSLIEQVRSEGASLSLSVLRANPARRLYERLGFAIVAETVNAYEMVLRD